jgi:hypothetical protein
MACSHHFTYVYLILEPASQCRSLSRTRSLFVFALIRRRIKSQWLARAPRELFNASKVCHLRDVLWRLAGR